MNLTKYQALLKTVELGSITRAAEAMGYTQSALSRAIADLEREWDLELLTRSRSGVALSSDGNVLLPAIRSLCNAAKMLEEQVAELHGMTRGTLRVGTFTSVSIHWLPGIMKVFLDRYPGIHFELVSSWEFAEIEDLIRRGGGGLRISSGPSRRGPGYHPPAAGPAACRTSPRPPSGTRPLLSHLPLYPGTIHPHFRRARHGNQPDFSGGRGSSKPAI